MSSARSKALALAGALATAFVLLAATIRNHPVDRAVATIPLDLPAAAYPPVAEFAGIQAESLEFLAAHAPAPEEGAAVASGETGRRAASEAPAVVSATVAPATVRKVIVGKGKRVVRHVPVAPAPVQQQEAAPATRTARFDMSQGGKRMTADEFDAWMKAQGIRVATGSAKPADSQASAPAALPAACTPQPDKAC